MRNVVQINTNLGHSTFKHYDEYLGIIYNYSKLLVQAILIPLTMRCT